MPLTDTDIVEEDGTGLATATSYIDRAAATTYHRLRGNDLWADADVNDQCVALIRATQYLDTRWIWLDTILVETQALQFPRYDLENRDGYDVGSSVPQEIADACCEYALEVLGDGTALVELSPTPSQSTGAKVTMQRDKVGDLETETRFEAGMGVRFTTTFPHADRIIKRSGYAVNGSGNGGSMR